MIARHLYIAWLQYRLRRLLSDAARSREIQEQVLLRKLARNADSDFGREYGLTSVRSAREFRSRVPVMTYEEHHPYLWRVWNGETNALFARDTRIRMFAMTSGTTGRPKRLPITAELFREYQNGWRLWAAGAFGDHQDLLRKKTLRLSSDWQQFHSPTGIPCGQISGLAATTHPRVASFMFSPPPATVQIHDWAARQYATLRMALATSRIGMIATANPSTLIEFARRAQQNCESLLRDIHDGTLSCDVPPNIRSALRPWFSRRNPRRARELERLESRYGGLFPKDAWPQLSLLAAWTGGSVGIFSSQLADWYGPVTVRDHGLSASEGRMTIPLADHDSSGLLDIYHSYFEFIPADEHDNAAPTVLQPHELAVGGDYYILLTTSGGLYRYDIQDIVRCTGFIGQAPLLRFLNKGSYFSNFTGEKLSEHHVVSAVKSAFKELGLAADLFMVAPEMQLQPRYILLLERGSHAARQSELAARVQLHLERLNEEYASRTHGGRLLPLHIREVPDGTWLKMRDEMIHARGNVEEFKHAFLAQDLSLVERLTANTDLIAERKATAQPVRVGAVNAS